MPLIKEPLRTIVLPYAPTIELDLRTHAAYTLELAGDVQLDLTEPRNGRGGSITVMNRGYYEVGIGLPVGWTWQWKGDFVRDMENFRRSARIDYRCESTAGRDAVVFMLQPVSVPQCSLWDALRAEA